VVLLLLLPVSAEYSGPAMTSIALLLLLLLLLHTLIRHRGLQRSAAAAAAQTVQLADVSVTL
jgi:hypothetical protein